MSRSLRLVIALALAAVRLQGQVDPGPHFRELDWHPVNPAALTPAELAGVGAAHFIDPASWGLEAAAETLGTTSFLFLRAKIGGGTGYRYYATFGFIPRQRMPVWASLAEESYAPWDSSRGPEAFTLTGCLVRGTGPLLGYATVTSTPNATAREALEADSLVPASGWYLWADGTFARLSTQPVEELRAWCRDHPTTFP